MLSAAVQAGGNSTRMGENKALKHFLGRPLIQRVLERLAPIADEILITSNEAGAFDFLGYRQEKDLRPGIGALGGLHTALCKASFPVVAVVACDLPFVSAPLLAAAAKIIIEEAADVVIAETPDGFEPMHAVYRRDTCRPAIEAAIDAGKRRVISWFPQVRLRRLSAAEITRYDPDQLAFRNVNTPEEFEEAERHARTME